MNTRFALMVSAYSIAVSSSRLWIASLRRSWISFNGLCHAEFSTHEALLHYPVAVGIICVEPKGVLTLDAFNHTVPEHPKL
jgi:hypothetical protein